jgi:hypothetical protein
VQEVCQVQRFPDIFFKIRTFFHIHTFPIVLRTQGPRKGDNHGTTDQEEGEDEENPQRSAKAHEGKKGGFQP